jgi:isocitrate/isopropylmalate dehydrogenase
MPLMPNCANSIPYAWLRKVSYKICLLPSDGIGTEVIASARDVLTALPFEWDFVECGIGYGEYQRSGSPLPDSTIGQIRLADAALFGAVTTP